MGCCVSDTTPDVPLNIIPDPNFLEQATFTIKKCGMFSRDYEAYRGPQASDQTRWLFLNKAGSKWGGECCIDVENYIRGGVPENLKKGQILWRAEFKDTPHFKQQLVTFGNPVTNLFMGFMGDMRHWNDHGHYMNHGHWASRDYNQTLLINWCMETEAVLSTTSRPGVGHPLKLKVYACGTAIARYYQVHTPVYEDRNGQQVKVGERWQWEHTAQEYVDVVQFQVVHANTGDPVIMSNTGQPWQYWLPGDAMASRAVESRYTCPMFTLQQSGGWDSGEPVTVTSEVGCDPALALLLAHLATSEFSVEAIKGDFHPAFPTNPQHA